MKNITSSTTNMLYLNHLNHDTKNKLRYPKKAQDIKIKFTSIC